ncbi:MAG: orotidine-5'-phosphate decarboxylase [Elusimicrobiota bacterium]
MAEIIFALDFDKLSEAENWVNKLKYEIDFFKIGLQLFTRYGPPSVEMIKRYNKKVFLDLKVHDIPKISAKAVEFAAKAGCYSITIHIQAGKSALQWAKKSRINGFPHIWGVTLLSSLTQGTSMERAQLASDCQIDGVIVSGEDVEEVSNKFPELEIVVPGIRPSSYNKKDDQKRTLTPKQAVDKGADFLVIGRPIKESSDPIQTVRNIKEELGG